jgi:hypothetical protein
MGSEEPWLLAFPYPLALPISSLSLILKGILAKEEESIVSYQRSFERRILSTIRNWFSHLGSRVKVLGVPRIVPLLLGIPTLVFLLSNIATT